MSSEETPLLQEHHDDIYERFTSRQKRGLIAIVICGGLVTFFTVVAILPSILQMAKDFNTTGEVIGYAVSVTILASAVGGLIGARYAKFYGRRPCYLYNLPIMVIGSLGTAFAQTVPQLIIWRFLQAMGVAPFTSVGAGVIGDIYKLEERGAVLGTYFGIGLLGLAISPTISGIVAHHWSWRVVHLGLAIFASAAFILIFFCFPETSHPGSRDIDKYGDAGKSLPKWRPVILNPLTPLAMLRSPIILSVSIITCVALLTDFALMIPLAFTIGKRYEIDDEATLGLFLLPIGFGNAVGAPISGWISDKMVIHYKAKRQYWYPEDRLRAALFGAYLPITVFASAFVTEYIAGRLGIILNLVIFFFNGFGTDIVLTAYGAYVVDVVHSNSAEVTAAVNTPRAILLAISSTALLPMINAYGQLVTNACVAVLVTLGFILSVLLVVYGDTLRALVDIGYSTADTN
ncbi:hypothetical protein Agabi119p4_5375 [Agaricus bisporus var. burnettii]|uniref:Major facilitator superfamily (MFS) profile domain-containing protein n=1 Tax=Agaricus bisporus var. burnettii TaxID=192524 RepID=A0A8H7F1K5_AGABI|nr:hypothetical protein Agabi119p4_5375 [Agaricus bisporus var. burnettii]